MGLAILNCEFFRGECDLRPGPICLEARARLMRFFRACSAGDSQEDLRRGVCRARYL